MPVDLNSPVWSGGSQEDIVSRCLTRLAKRFKSDRVSAMVAGPHTGRLYRRPSGSGSLRFHRASARGERPAPDTTNLINSVTDTKISALQHSVEVDDAKAPYGKWLQDEEWLDRPIATLEDAESFMQTPIAQAELEKAKAELAEGITGETL